MERITREQWQRVEVLFDEALDLPADERAAFLEVACGEDADLRARVDALLASSAADGFLETAIAGHAALLFAEMGEAPAEPGPGDTVGRYRIVERIGAGGMGAVYLAQRADGAFEQRVALKLVRSGLASEDFRRRFLQERQILARLEHPHIARLVDGGADELGRPFLAMEYVRGVPLTAYCDAHRLGLKDRLALFAQVCDAVQYAHQNLVIHRDLKPSNVLVTEDGQVKLLDFGIAKVLHEDDEDPEAGLTRVGLRVLTPDYAAPEQVLGEPVTTATDVYALGAMLYELTSGRRPHRLVSYTAVEVEREVCHNDPLPPSTAVVRAPPTLATGAVADAEALSRARGLTAKRLRHELRGDLDAIVLQALQKEPARRYRSAEALLEDVRRFEAGKPVSARRENVAYRMGKFVRRHAVGVGAAAVVLLSLIGGLAGTAWQARVAAREAAKAREVSAFLSSLFELSDPDVSNGSRVTARELLEDGTRRIETELAGQPEVGAEMLGLLGDIHRKLGLLDRADSLLQRAYRLETQLHDRDDPEVATVLAAIGNLRSDQGRPNEAAEAHRQALAIREARLSHDDPQIARSLRDLATALMTLGQLDEAERLQRRGLAIDQRHFGEPHAEVARDREILSLILRSRGDFDGAIIEAQRTLDMRLATLGPDHLETATAKNNLALLHSDKGELDQAESYFREVLAFDLERLGTVHPYTATVTNNLALVLQRKGELEASEAMYRSALGIATQLFGERHEDVASVHNNLGVVLREEGRLTEAESEFRKALAIFSAVFDEDHPAVSTAHYMLASALQPQGRTREADSLYVIAIDRLRATYPEGHPRLASALVGKAKLLVAIGEAPGAEPLLREAIAMRAAAYGENNTPTLDARRTLGDCLVALGRYGEAEATLTAVWTALDEHPWAVTDRARTAHSLVALYDHWGRPRDADPYRSTLTMAPPR